MCRYIAIESFHYTSDIFLQNSFRCLEHSSLESKQMVINYFSASSRCSLFKSSITVIPIYLPQAYHMPSEYLDLLRLIVVLPFLVHQNLAHSFLRYVLI
jgi:hypothetical protein